MAKVLYLISGVPGSGKTTLAEILWENHSVGEWVEADHFFMKNGEYKFDPSKIMEAHEWCFRQTMDAMFDGINVVVSNTFTKDIFLQRYIDLAKEYGYNIVEIVMKSTFDSVHNVPPATVNKMKLQLQERLNNDWALK